MGGGASRGVVWERGASRGGGWRLVSRTGCSVVQWAV